MQPFESGQFDISIPPPGKDKEPKIDVIINVKDKYLNYAFHTRRQIYLTSVGLEWKTVSLDGSYPYEGYQFASSLTGSGSDSAMTADDPTLLTSGDQGSVSESKFSPEGSQVVWLEMQEDGNESDRNTVVVYDLEARKKSVWTENWDRSPSSVTVSIIICSVWDAIAVAEISFIPFRYAVVVSGRPISVRHRRGSRLFLALPPQTGRSTPYPSLFQRIDRFHPTLEQHDVLAGHQLFDTPDPGLRARYQQVASDCS
jgi:hypothetical protein